MKNQNYNRHNDFGISNREDNSAYLIVNCAGVCAFDCPFETNMPQGRNDVYMIYLYKGELELHAGGEIRVMHAGQMIFFAPHTPYRYRKTDHTEMDYLWVHFTGFDALQLMEKCGFSARTLYEIGVGEEVVLAFSELFEEFIRNDFCADSACAAKACSLFVLLARLAARRGRGKEDLRSFQHSKEYMHRNFASEICIGELACMENLSVSRYRAAFRAHTGLSPSEYLAGLRMRNACTMLEQTDLSIQEIAQASGYEDSLYFSRIFRKNIGLSPSQYREMCSKGHV